MLAADDVRAMVSFVHEQRAQAGLGSKPFDIAHNGISSGADQQADRALAQMYADAGVTWWLEHLLPERWGDGSEWPLDAMRERIRRGPLRLRRTAS
jgi:hypothetical protein